MNILLLEDESDLSAVAVLQLENRGYNVLTAKSLEEASQILENNLSIDILIADHHIPDGSGAHFAIQTKGMPRKIKTVVVSGCLTIDEVEELEAHGIAYYNKPLLYAQVVDDLIEKHL